MTVFVSYRHVEPDVTLADRLAEALTGAGHRVFIDTNIAPGQQWADVIEQELANADFLIAIISQASAASSMVVTEISEAHRLNVERGGRPVIVPVRLGDAFRLRYPLSAYVARFQHATWSGPEQTEALIAQIIDALAMPPAERPRGASQRLALIDRVRGDWIRGVLETSLYRIARLELGLEMKHDAVSRGLDAVVQRPDEGPLPIPPATPLVDIFDDHRGQLLILGPPGGGKTTLLLELARDLLDRAAADESLPIPVVFNLSSWAINRKPLADWMIDELQLRYDAPRALAREWVEREQILPLLDGLDEVEQLHRNACVEAVNEYRRAHGWVPMVVCSRLVEYQALATSLMLSAAVVVQPLQRTHVEQYLADAGDALASVRSALDSAPGLWELLQTPLMLSIVALAYRNRTDVPASLGEQQVFGHYVDAMFKRRAKELRYGEPEIRAWLHWLASNLVERAQSVFFLEDVVPEWFLSSRASAMLNAVMVAIVAGLSVAWFELVFEAGDWFAGDDSEDWTFVALLTLPVAIVVAAVYGRRAAPVDALQLRLPSWRGVFAAVLRGVAIGFIIGETLALAGCRILSWSLEQPFPIVQAVPEMLPFAMIGGVTLPIFLVSRIVLVPKMLGQRGAPGALVTRSARSAFVTLAVSLVIGIPFAGGVIEDDATILESFPVILQISARFVSWCGLFVALDRGGYFIIRHYLARLVLWLTRRGPWHYTSFLDVASERLLLRKVGGGYIFVHRKLLEYLARTAPIPPSTAVGG